MVASTVDNFVKFISVAGRASGRNFDNVVRLASDPAISRGLVNILEEGSQSGKSTDEIAAGLEAFLKGRGIEASSELSAFAQESAARFSAFNEINDAAKAAARSGETFGKDEIQAILTRNDVNVPDDILKEITDMHEGISYARAQSKARIENNSNRFTAVAREANSGSTEARLSAIEARTSNLDTTLLGKPMTLGRSLAFTGAGAAIGAVPIMLVVVEVASGGALSQKSVEELFDLAEYAKEHDLPYAEEALNTAVDAAHFASDYMNAELTAGQNLVVLAALNQNKNGDTYDPESIENAKGRAVEVQLLNPIGIAIDIAVLERQTGIEYGHLSTEEQDIEFARLLVARLVDRCDFHALKDQPVTEEDVKQFLINNGQVLENPMVPERVRIALKGLYPEIETANTAQNEFAASAQTSETRQPPAETNTSGSFSNAATVLAASTAPAALGAAGAAAQDSLEEMSFMDIILAPFVKLGEAIASFFEPMINIMKHVLQTAMDKLSSGLMSAWDAVAPNIGIPQFNPNLPEDVRNNPMFVAQNGRTEGVPATVGFGPQAPNGPEPEHT